MLALPMEPKRSQHPDGEDNPFAAPNSVANVVSEPQTYHLRLFLPGQVAAAAIVGHVLAAAVLVAWNHHTLGERLKAAATVAVGVLYTGLSLTFADQLPPRFVLCAVSFAIVASFAWSWLVFRRLIRAGVEDHDTWKSLVVGVVALAAQVSATVLLH